MISNLVLLLVVFGETARQAWPREKGLIGDGGEKGTESSPAVKLIQIVLLLLPCSVQLQHYEDSDTFSACWVIWAFP